VAPDEAVPDVTVQETEGHLVETRLAALICVTTSMQ